MDLSLESQHSICPRVRIRNLLGRIQIALICQRETRRKTEREISLQSDRKGKKVQEGRLQMCYLMLVASTLYGTKKTLYRTPV